MSKQEEQKSNVLYYEASYDRELKRWLFGTWFPTVGPDRREGKKTQSEITGTKFGWDPGMLNEDADWSDDRRVGDYLHLKRF